MLKKLRPRSAYDVMAVIALFVAVSTGGAYAANTVFSTDIVDGQVKTVDLGDAAVVERKLINGAVTSDKFRDDNLTERKLADGAVTSDKFRDNNLRSRDVLDNTLTGADIDERTLLGGLRAGTNVVTRTQGTSRATCQSGETLIGGGGDALGPDDVLWQSRPSPTDDGSRPTEWVVSAIDKEVGGSICCEVAFALCARP
jgi:hypothetical protein